MKRRLHLKKENLTELTTDEIRRVVGGGAASEFTDCAKFTCAADGCWQTITPCIPTVGCTIAVETRDC